MVCPAMLCLSSPRCMEHTSYLDLLLLVGCTETFILLDSVMQQIKRERTLGVFNLLKNVQRQRMKMVQAKVSCTLTPS